MKLSKIKLYYYTIRYLKWIQVRYQIWYRVRSEWRNFFNHKYPLSSPSHPVSLKFIDWIDKPETVCEYTFRFLNLAAQFENHEVQWGFDRFGKLWNYNLNYMDFLLQPDMGKDEGIQFIQDFIQKLSYKSTGLEPYPISLRGINWIKFLSKHEVENSAIENSLFAQYRILVDNIEYHISGNHLLENGFSLLFGAFYYNDLKLFNKAKDIIETELNDQILEDGGHFELSPMYHEIILDRLLDCINLLQNNKLFNEQDSLISFLDKKSVGMLQWLNCMTFSNGKIPLLNDSTKGIAPSTQQLNDYAIRLKIKSEKSISQIGLNFSHSCLKDSGYRLIKGSNWECIIDVGKPGADYQPGHAHADTFNFELYLKGKPLIVDTGISTYEKNIRRQLERSTSSHNTIQVGNFDSSEVWDGFRVARRARIVSMEEKDTEIRATHDGYRNLGLLHERTLKFSNNVLIITDNLIGKNQVQSVARIHLHPDVRFQKKDNSILIDGLEVEFFGQDSINLTDYLYACQFNSLIPSKVIELSFSRQLNSVFHFS